MVTYVKLFKCADDGHRYFREYLDGMETGRIAVADNSGSTPPQTEDGVLYLDTNKDLELGLGSSVRIPLNRPDGNETATGECLEGAFQVAEAFEMQLVVTVAGVRRKVQLVDKNVD